MIIGIGNDLCNISRIEKILEKNPDGLLRRLFSPLEMQYFEKRNFQSISQQAAYIAKRFAGKEACAKAIGTGFAEGVLWKDIQIVSEGSGKPKLLIEGNSLKTLQLKHKMDNFIFHISLSDDYPWAQAFVIIETN